MDASEHEPQPPNDPLDTELLHGQSLRTWHRVLTHDANGEPTGHLTAPTSRYGRNGDECAYWALACEMVYLEVNGENRDEDPRIALDFYMGLVVNDHQDVLDVILNYWYAVPEALREYLDYEDNGLNMNQQAALSSLCGRFGEQYSAEHYTPQFDLPDRWVGGWLGGPERRGLSIFVGCSPQGEITT